MRYLSPDNLPEAIRAFDQGRSPVYTDEPRKDLFTAPAGTADADDPADPKV